MENQNTWPMTTFWTFFPTVTFFLQCACGIVEFTSFVHYIDCNYIFSFPSRTWGFLLLSSLPSCVFFPAILDLTLPFQKFSSSVMTAVNLWVSDVLELNFLFFAFLQYWQRILQKEPHNFSTHEYCRPFSIQTFSCHMLGHRLFYQRRQILSQLKNIFFKQHSEIQMQGNNTSWSESQAIKWFGPHNSPER